MKQSVIFISFQVILFEFITQEIQKINGKIYEAKVNYT